MYILRDAPSAVGQYEPIQQTTQPLPPPGYLWWPDSLDRAVFDQYEGFVVPTIKRNTVASYVANKEAYEAWKAEQLAARKVERIAESKARLSDYLLCHPMQWTDGQRYAITAEKQQQLTSKIMSATMAQTMSVPYNLTWNSTGDECTTWTLPDLSSLAFAIDSRVTSLVSYQQEKEVEMQNAATMDDLEAITVDYDSVPLPAAPTNGGEQA